MVKQLIVTGDDYGLSSSINEAIEECLQNGVMRATCVMMNMPAWAQAARLRSRFPNCSVGIHWNLTQGRPVLSAHRVPTLVDHEGQFHRSLRRPWLARKIQLFELQAELRAQYARFCAVAAPPDFWNTHQDSHLCPGLFRVFVDLGKELGIPAMRSHRRFTVPQGSSSMKYHLQHPLYWAKGRLLARWCDRAQALGVLMPAGRFHMPGYKADSAALRQALERLPWERVSNAVELATHPATRVEAEVFGALTESRIRDYHLFRDRHLCELLRQIGVRPVGFADLRRERSARQAGVAA
jgi:predicted glycoside hydrolase/deacetylase ChbG (UPF0249 family)